MHTKLARIKNLKNLNIGTDRPMQKRRPRSDAAENKGMKLLWGNRGIGLWAFQDHSPSIVWCLHMYSCIFHGYSCISVVFRYLGKSCDRYTRISKLI